MSSRLLLALLALLATACRTTRDPGVAIVESFREARDAGDLDAARSYMSADPRRWWDEKEGEGSPWTLGTGGPWSAWDDHFNGVTERVTDWQVEDDAVHADFFETNDYFRLTERGGGYWRGTYFLGADGKIVGFMISGVRGRESTEGRGDEFREWAFANHPDEAEYLMPEGSLDPTGDRPPRMRRLLEAWRGAIGLPAID